MPTTAQPPTDGAGASPAAVAEPSEPRSELAGHPARATRDKTTAHHVSPEAVRVLIIATVLFTIFFAVWVMFAIVGLPMRKELGLSEGEFALLVQLADDHAFGEACDAALAAEPTLDIGSAMGRFVTDRTLVGFC